MCPPSSSKLFLSVGMKHGAPWPGNKNPKHVTVSVLSLFNSQQTGHLLAMVRLLGVSVYRKSAGGTFLVEML